MKLSPFGKEVRKLRIEHGMLMKDMAEKLALSPSWLSAMETGRKSVPEDTVDSIAILFQLDTDATARLRMAASESKERYTIRPGDDPLRRDVAAALARRFDSFGERELRELQELVRRGAK